MSEGVLDTLMAEGFSSLLAPVSEIKTESGVSLSFSLGSSNVTEGGVEARHQSSLSAFEMAVNRGGATAKDVLLLIDHIKETVLNKFGVSLECEIKYVD